MGAALLCILLAINCFDKNERKEVDKMTEEWVYKVRRLTRAHNLLKNGPKVKSYTGRMCAPVMLKTLFFLREPGRPTIYTAE